MSAPDRRALEAQLAELAELNLQLAVRAEEALLLRSVSGQIEGTARAATRVEDALEAAVLVRELSWGACLVLGPRSHVLCAYSAHSHDAPIVSVSAPELAQRLRTVPWSGSRRELVRAGLDVERPPGVPRSTCLITLPFTAPGLAPCALVFATAAGPEEAATCLGLLERVFAHLSERLASDHAVRELERLNRELEERVEERTAERVALEAQLLHAQKLESVGRLAGGVAHDFNNLLTPILGWTELLLSRADDSDPSRPALETILDAGRRARDLTRQILAYGRKQVMDMRTVDLAEVVSGFTRVLRSTVREDIELTLHLLAHKPCVNADPAQLEQVLMNLVVNAQDAMPRGGTLALTVADASIDHVALVVTDSGTGIAPEVLNRVFEPFFSTKAAGVGTGLGLSVVQGIVEQHEGSIEVHSRPDSGTTFRVLLPRTAPVEVVRAVPRAAEEAGGTDTILVVEDNDLVRDLVCAVLQRYGYDVLEADGPYSCIELLRERGEPPDLMLTDVVMPGMDGRQLFETVRRTFPGLRVLYMTGYAEDVLEARGLRDDGMGFIHKPLSIHELLEKLRGLLDGPPTAPPE